MNSASNTIKMFPTDFIWGTAIAAHQVEGNNTNSDWWQYEITKEKEKRAFPLEPSGEGCDFYNRFEEDFELCQKLNNNAVRISIEWSRIEPTPGEFSDTAIEHYRKVLETARSKGLKTFVTLHHFTNPLWFSRIGGWHNLQAPKYFRRYSRQVAKKLDSLIDFYITINEPQVYVLLGYKGVYDWMQKAKAQWPPAKNSYFLGFLALLNFIRAHNGTYKDIKSISPNSQVGIVHNISWFHAHPESSSLLDHLVAKLLRITNRDTILIPTYKKCDFIGLNYYFTSWIKNLKVNNLDDKCNDLGWWIYPEGLEFILKKLKRFNKPIYVTENGLADATDSLRSEFIRDHLHSCHRAIEAGVDLRGYLHWSLMDNYEWHQGYWPRFGLVEIDREHDLARKPRDSFYYYAQVCKNNSIDLAATHA